MSSLMPCDVLGDAAPFGNGTDSGETRVIVGYGEYPAVLAQPTVFVDNVLRNVKQSDVGHHACLLAVDVYPLVFVEVGADILFRKVAHIRERQPREGAEQVEVAVQFLFGVFQFPLHQQADLIFGQETACCFLLLDFILAERVARQPLVVDGDEYHRP